jgi:hypothetical protein
MNSKAVLENVRRYRAIASLYRQTAAFRPPQRFSLLEQAKEWERLALAELESYFSTPRGSKYLASNRRGCCGGSATRHTVGEVFDCPQEYTGLPPSPI